MGVVVVKMTPSEPTTHGWVDYKKTPVAADDPNLLKGFFNEYRLISEGHTLIVLPADINKKTCTHPKGFERSGIEMSHRYKVYTVYMCNICHLDAYMLKYELEPETMKHINVKDSSKFPDVISVTQADEIEQVY